MLIQGKGGGGFLPLCRQEAQFHRRMASSRTCLAAAFAATILPPAAGLVSSPHLHLQHSSLPTPFTGVAASSAASSRSQAPTSLRRAAEEGPGSSWFEAGADENENEHEHEHEHGSPSSSSSRRGALRAASAGILAAASAIFSSAASASAAAQVGAPKDGGTMGPKSSGMGGGSADPFKQTFQRGISKRSDRLYGCATQKNCVSSAAVKNPSQFSAPWDYTISTPDAAQAWRKLKAEIEADESLKLIEADESKLYIRAEGTSKVPATGIDDVEFLLIPDQKILTYRSASRENVYVYPYQVPIPDGGYQKARMEAIRSRLGWVELNYAGDGIYSDKDSAPPGSPGGASEAEYLKEYGDMPRADRFRLPW